MLKFDVAQSLSMSATSYANERGSDWPFVTTHDFELRSRKARVMSEVDLIMFVPLFLKDRQKDWEAYAQNHSSWIQEGLALNGHKDTNPGPVPQFIHDISEMSDEMSEPTSMLDDYIAALWYDIPMHELLFVLFSVNLPFLIQSLIYRQTGPAPIDASVVNTDLLSDGTFFGLATDVVKKRFSYISKIYSLPIMQYFPEPSELEYETKDHAHQERKLTSHSAGNPRSFLLDPIFRESDDQGEVVGFHYLDIEWDVFFQDVLPEGTGDIEVVLSDSCGRVLTYLVQGPHTHLKGEGDLHDTDFDDKVLSSNITEHGSNTERGQPYSSCNYVLDIYPTGDLENDYESRDPIIYAIVVATIFVFTTFVFLVYDWAVQRRQWMIIRAARKTQAIVSSLFPKNVQDRIMKDVDEEVNREANKQLTTRGNRTKDQLQNFLKGKDANEEDEDARAGIKRSKPIADLFPEATIIFADIVGFTAWSSTREPTQVFQLLETIYHVFDEIAGRRRVFKVETVGDCYVAVAGLPEPRKDHAVVMARFARDCLVQFTATMKAMVVELGPETEEVSPPVTVPPLNIHMSLTCLPLTTFT